MFSSQSNDGLLLNGTGDPQNFLEGDFISDLRSRDSLWPQNGPTYLCWNGPFWGLRAYQVTWSIWEAISFAAIGESSSYGFCTSMISSLSILLRAGSLCSTWSKSCSWNDLEWIICLFWLVNPFVVFILNNSLYSKLIIGVRNSGIDPLRFITIRI